MPFLKSKKQESTVPQNGEKQRESRRTLFSKKKSKNEEEDIAVGGGSGSLISSMFGRQQTTDDQREEGDERSSSIVKKLFSNRTGSRRDESVETTERSAESHSQAKVVYHNFGQDGDELLTLQREDSIPHVEADDDVIVKVEASTVTLNDCLLRRGFDFNIFAPQSLPITPGGDVVGNIIEIGDGVKEFVSGDRVAGLVRSGGNARYVRVPAKNLVKVPPGLDSGEVAALVSIYTTAYQALRSISSGRPMFSLDGKNVLILGGLDGVAQALMQLCKKAQAIVYVVAPLKRHSYLRSYLGVLPLNEDDWLPTVEGEIDYVFDGICENGSEEPLKTLKENGELVTYAQASMLKEESIGMFGVPLHAHMNKFCSTLTSRQQSVDIWESFKSNPEIFKSDLQNLLQWLKWKKVVPHIAKRVSLAQVGSAQTQLEQGEVRGTIVCFPGRPAGSTAKSERE